MPIAPLFTVLSGLAFAPVPLPAQDHEIIAPRVDGIGSEENLDRMPGPATVVDEEILDSGHVLTTAKLCEKFRD